MFTDLIMCLGYLTFGFISYCIIDGTIISVKEYFKKKRESHETE